MKRFFIFGIIVAAIIVGIIFLAFQSKRVQKEKVQQPLAAQISKIKLTSSAFSHNQMIPQRYTCDGENVSPPLTIAEVPENAQSLVLIVDDPDAPMGTFVHWTVWNIEPTTTEIRQNSVPEGAQQGMTDFGRTGYGGPCPPSGTHRYFFKLYALDTKLELPESIRKSDIENAMQGHILAQTELIGLYSRGR